MVELNSKWNKMDLSENRLPPNPVVDPNFRPQSGLWGTHRFWDLPLSGSDPLWTLEVDGGTTETPNISKKIEANHDFQPSFLPGADRWCAQQNAK